MTVSSTPVAATASPKVQWDNDRNEPYILIPGRPDFRLTPVRAGDEAHSLRLCNEPSIGQWTYRRPFPLTRADAESWTKLLLSQYQAFFPRLRESLQTGGSPPIHGLRTVLRHVPVSPEAELGAYLAERGVPAGAQLGTMQVWPSEWESLSEAAMLALPPREQIWEIAYDLLPALHGRGLGTGMITAVMEAWTRWLGIGTVIANVQTVNAPSRGLIAKSGFVEEEKYMRMWPAEKGGGEREMSRWVWKAGEVAP